jgi:hypothetical protein
LVNWGCGITEEKFVTGFETHDIIKVYLITLSVTDDTVLDDGQLVNIKLVRMWKSLLPSWRYDPALCLEGPKKTMKILSG